MDIYKLKDFEKGGGKLVFDGDNNTDSSGAASWKGARRYDEGVLKITGMKAGVKNPERVNVYINDGFEFSLDLAQVVELGVKVGKVISVEELEIFKKESEFGKLYQRTLEWVLARPRSERECADYLRKKTFEKKMDKKNIDNIMKKLKDKSYLNDEKFARWWVENRFTKKGVSQKRLRVELVSKGVAKEIIDEVLWARDDKVEIQKIIEKKRGKYTSEKMMAYLCRQGFSYDLAREMVEQTDDE